MLQKQFRVALIYDARLAYDLKIMAGVAMYLREGANFSIYIEENALKDQRLPDLHAWDGNGIIADFDDPGVATAVIQSKLPAVGFGSGYGWYRPESRIPYFFTNNQAISRLAADHLLERGFRRFAYCGYPQTSINGWSQERERAFSERVGECGFGCEVYHARYKTNRQWSSDQLSLGTWLMSLPKPLGLMAANDNRARQVLEACRARNLRVPEEVAVIGVDNDELLCRLSSPLLTSVEQAAKRIGYDAAALLNKIMQGEKPSRPCFVVDPVRVVTRQSTEALAIEDSKVANAMAFIQDRAGTSIKVRDVVDAAAISRSSLETRFIRALGYSVHTAIRRAQLERAKLLVLDTDMPLKQVASKTGFKSVQHLTTLFGDAFGEPPAKYRKAATFRAAGFPCESE